MSSNIANQIAYLRTTRDFPEDLHELSIECDKAYLDTANAINVRTIGLFAVNRPVITGNQYFITRNQRQQSLRQVYPFTGAGNIAHGILNLSPTQPFTGYGNYTDGTNSYGVLFASNVGIAGQVTFYVTATNIVVLVDAGAPVPVSGNIVFEWLSVT